MKYRVHTIDQTALAAAARELYRLAKDDFQPQLIVGVRTGGYLVAELMGHEADGAALLPLTSQRPGTARKSKSAVFKHGLRRLPYFVNDRLRLFEHRMLLAKANDAVSSLRTMNPDELAAIESAIRGGPMRILVVDDAVDSGSTLLTVSARLKKLGGPESTVKTAAITVTTPAPLIDPDYVLYRHVLCRFPWSFDFRS